MNDEQLIQNILQNNRAAVNELVERNQNLVWHIIISLTGRNSDAEDLFQEVLMQVFKNLKKFNRKAKLSTWIGSIAHNHCVDYLRRKKRYIDYQKQEMEDLKAGNIVKAVDWKEVEKTDLRQIIRSAISALPPVFSLVITLYHLDERSYKEITEITGMPEGTVKSYISRGRSLLRETLKTQIPDIEEVLNDLS